MSIKKFKEQNITPFWDALSGDSFREKLTLLEHDELVAKYRGIKKRGSISAI